MKIKVTKMGTNSMAEFMLHVVRWKNSAPVYLHCEVSLCENNCTPTCSTNRKKRETESRDQTKTTEIDQIEFSENENNDIFDDRCFEKCKYGCFSFLDDTGKRYIA